MAHGPIQSIIVNTSFLASLASMHITHYYSHQRLHAVKDDDCSRDSKHEAYSETNEHYHLIRLGFIIFYNVCPYFTSIPLSMAVTLHCVTPTLVEWLVNNRKILQKNLPMEEQPISLSLRPAVSVTLTLGDSVHGR